MLALGLDIGGSSVKAALIVDGRRGAVARSDLYERPDREALALAIGQAASTVLEGVAVGVDAIGLCVPGLLDRARLCIVTSVNVPGIVGVPLGELVGRALSEAGHVPTRPGPPVVTSELSAS